MKKAASVILPAAQARISTSRVERPRLVGEHDRDTVTDRVGELGGAADQLLALGVVFERRLGERTDQDLEKLRVDDAGRADGIAHPSPHCNERLPPPSLRASDVSVIATSVSARLLRSGASSSACFSMVPKGAIMASALTKVSFEARPTLSQSASRL